MGVLKADGNVLLILKEITNPDQGYEYGRNPKAEVYAQIEKDLTEANDGLKTKSEYAAIDMGRATKGAAQSLLGKVLLTEHKYAEAAVQLKKVIDSQIYDLLPLYADVFKVSNKNHKGIKYLQKMDHTSGYTAPAGAEQLYNHHFL